jgi:hypothetical protein
MEIEVEEDSREVKEHCAKQAKRRIKLTIS